MVVAPIRLGATENDITTCSITDKAVSHYGPNHIGTQRNAALRNLRANDNSVGESDIGTLSKKRRSIFEKDSMIAKP